MTPRRALPLPDAFARIAGDDPRPLLVLRECLSCNGTDDALLTRQEDNERTLLMSRWFHCVKLPPAVLEEDHPFHALFAGDDPGHLFVARRDGSGRVDLLGDQSRTELWGVLEGRLALEYEQQPSFESSVRALLKTLDRFDALDGEIRQLEERLDLELEGARPNARKLKKLEGELAERREELARLKAEATGLATLRPRRAPEPAGATAPTGG